MEDQRVLIFIVAYNAETTIEDVLRRIPRSIFDYDCEILVIDDQSSDDTFRIAARYRDANPEHKITVLFNPANQGYGGNQKVGYEYAIENGFDCVVLLHGDGQYAPEVMDSLIRPILEGRADAVFGSRMSKPRSALSGGMPLYKFAGNRILTWFQNHLLGSSLSEFHSGYRAYSVPALGELPFRCNSNDFHFDTEIIIQFLLKRLRILEAPIPTYYGGEICRVNGMAYAFNVIKATLASRIHRMGLLYQRQFDVGPPEEKYGLKLGYLSSHSLAIARVKPTSKVLDIGCGRGLVGAELRKKNCYVKGLDGIEPEHVAGHIDAYEKIDLNSGELPRGIEDFNVILLLDLLEHLDLTTQRRLLDNIRARCGPKKPLLIITLPNIAFLPIRLQLLLGNFNYGLRGVLDATHRHLCTFRSALRELRQAGYAIRSTRGIPPPYPEAIGNNIVSRAMLKITQFLIALLPGVFSYQIFITATPLPTVGELLKDAQSCAERISRGS